MNAFPYEPLTAPPRRSWFRLDGRLDRSRYIAQSLGAIAIVFVALLAAGLVLPLAGSLGRMLYSFVGVLLLYGFLPIRFVQLTIRRAHDFNFGGWLALLLLVPIANCAFWIIPGSRGDNRYGSRPEAASAGTRVLATALFVLLVGGFLFGADHGNPRPSPAAPQPSTQLKPYTP